MALKTPIRGAGQYNDTIPPIKKKFSKPPQKNTATDTARALILGYFKNMAF